MDAELPIVDAEAQPGAAETRSFYGSLRRRLSSSLLKRRGLKATTVEALLLAPDVFMLLVRLAADSRVPKPSRALIGSAIVYFVAPFDLVPEALLGAGGFVDDLVLAAAVLSHALGPDLDDVAAEHWSGRQSARVALRSVLGSADKLLDGGPLGRLKRLLARRGVSL